MNLTYSILTIVFTAKKSFEAMGRLIGKSGLQTVKRLLPDHRQAFQNLFCDLALKFFRHKKELILIIDDIFIYNIYSRFMQGSRCFYDTQAGRRMLAYKLLVCGITDGNYFDPNHGLFSLLQKRYVLILTRLKMLLLNRWFWRE